jgi:carbonic anhydrase
MKALLSGALALLFSLGCAATDHPAAAPSRPRTSTAAASSSNGEAEKAAAALLGQLLHDNAAFVQHHTPSYFQPFQNDQHPRATVVACADSRFHLQSIDHAPDGDIFEIRNIGNQIDLTQGSVDYGIHHLHTPLLLIIGHVGCGAVKAALGDYSEEPAAIRRELDGLHLSIHRAAAESAKGSFEARWLAGVIANVHQQVLDALQEHAEAVRAGELYVVGAVYDFRGDLGKGKGRLHIVDINGEASPDRIESAQLLKDAKQLAGAP